MAKLKTHSASKKRFRVTGNGKLKMNHAGRRHRFVSKTKPSKKANSKTAYVSKQESKNIKKLLPYG